MATAPAFIVHHGNLESVEAREDALGQPEGTRLVLVSSNEREVVFRREHQIYHRMTVEEYMAGWESMRGIMDDGKDTTEERMKDRADEEERDRRQFEG